MKRELNQLSNAEFDLVVVGGGIYGVCIAWDAVLRGLSVALVEKDDFGSATSANSLKIVHGGLRYLQHGDLLRVRESVRERSTMLRIAPHLVELLPCLMPTYGHGMKGREIMTLAVLINDLASFDRNRGIEFSKRLPGGKIISRREVLEITPGIEEKGLNGGFVWYDAQMYSSERLTLAFVLSAARKGAVIANHLRAIGFLQEKQRITGVEVEDRLTGNRFSIRARLVVNAAGPWVDRVLGLLPTNGNHLGVQLAKAYNVSTRAVFKKFAVGLAGQQGFKDDDSILNSGNRLFFFTPWHGQSVIGTTYTAYHEDPDDFRYSEADVQDLLDQVNDVYRPANLTLDDVNFVYGGLVPMKGVNPDTGTVRRAKHFKIRDHRKEGLQGLISVLGVKYTTARDVAERVVDLVFDHRGQKTPLPSSATTPLYGGDMDEFEPYLTGEIKKHPYQLEDDQVRMLVHNYGTAYPSVLRYFDPNEDLKEQALLKAQILYSVHEEMAQKLGDVIFRRTELGTQGYPGEKRLGFCADIMANELGWDTARKTEEIDDVKDFYNMWQPHRQGVMEHAR